MRYSFGVEHPSLIVEPGYSRVEYFILEINKRQEEIDAPNGAVRQGAILGRRSCAGLGSDPSCILAQEDYFLRPFFLPRRDVSRAGLSRTVSSS